MHTHYALSLPNIYDVFCSLKLFLYIQPVHGVQITMDVLKRVLDDFVEYTQNAVDADRRKRRRLDVPYLIYHNSMFATEAAKSDGWKRYERFKLLLDETRFEREQLQIEFHESMLNASLPIIFGDEFEHRKQVILSRLRVDKLYTEVMLCTARRMGKTAGVCIFAAALLMALDNVEGVVFAVAQRASNRIIDEIYRIVYEHPTYGKYKPKQTKSQVSLRKPTDSKDCTIVAYPANSTTTLGFGANIVILDEAAYVKFELFRHTILPVAQQRRTILICISTPCETQNWFTQMRYLTDPDGDPLFKYHNLTLICPECEKLPNIESNKCTHMQYKRPLHLSNDKTERFAAVYEDDPETMAREMFGISMDNASDRLFIPEYVDEYLLSYVQINTPRPVLYVSVDPSGGSTMSLFTISAVTCIHEYTVEVFRGIYKNETRGFVEMGELLNRAFDRMLDEHWFKDARIVFYPESQLPNSAQTLVAAVEPRFGKRLVVLREGSAAGSPGVIKTAATTDMMVYCFQLALARRTMVVWERLIVDTNVPVSEMRKQHNTDDPRKFSDALLRMQLVNMRRILLNPERKIGEEKKFKTTGKTGSAPDDLAIAVIMHIFWIDVFWQKNRPEYMMAKNEIARALKLHSPVNFTNRPASYIPPTR